MSINGFYGGRQGQNFYISQVFNNFTAMMEDLGKGYSSSIGFGEYVMINYGAPTGYGFTCKIYKIEGENKSITDEIAVEFLENGLLNLWNDLNENNENIYTCVFSLTQDEDEDKNENETNPSVGPGVKPIVQYATVRPTTHLSENAEYEIECTFTDDSIKNFAIDQRENKHSINYNNTVWRKISGSEKVEGKIQIFTTSENISTDSIGYELITYLGGNIPTLSVNTKQIDADLEPSVSYSQPAIDNPHFTFNLPHRQVFIEEVDYKEYIPLDDSKSTTQIVYKNEKNENVSINNPQLKIHLPRDIKFWSGDEDIDQQIKNNEYVLPYIDDTSGEEIIPKLTIEGKKDYGNEDYYIHADTAYIYKVINATSDSFKLQYVGKLVQRAPDGWEETKELDTFDENGELNKFSITNFTNNNHEWKLQLHAPKPVSFINPTMTILDPENSPSVTQVIQEDAYQLQFKLPRASQWIILEKNTERKNGNYYLDSTTGEVYYGEDVNTIVAKIMGPQGPAGVANFLNDTLKVIIKPDENIENEDIQNSNGNTPEQKVLNYLSTLYVNKEGQMAVEFIWQKQLEDAQEVAVEAFKSYIYYTQKINEENIQWRYVQVSGETSSLDLEFQSKNFMFDGGLLSEDEE